MDIDLNKLNLLKRAVEKKFGSIPGSPSDFDSLAAQIQSASSKHLSASTIKRVWGYVKTPHSPTYTTLSVLARYVGFNDWYSFCVRTGGGDDSGFSNDGIVIATEMKVGDVLHIEWDDNKGCTVMKIEELAGFKVVEANNIKLKSGDTFTSSIFMIGDKFVATDCWREGAYLGTYTGARKGGIKAITPIGGES